MYGVMKACRLALPTPIVNIVDYTGTPTIEWYNGTGQYADWLIAHQAADGHWTASFVTGSPHLDTAWGVLILEFVPVVVKYKLTVTVVDIATTASISGATVVAEGPETRSGSTNPSGIIEFANLLAGPYIVTASASGYTPASVSVFLDSDKNIQIGLAPSFVIPEYPLGTILGLVMCLAAFAVFKSKRVSLHL